MAAHLDIAALKDAELGLDARSNEIAAVEIVELSPGCVCAFGHAPHASSAAAITLDRRGVVARSDHAARSGTLCHAKHPDASTRVFAEHARSTLHR
jgi:hypothetical protein